MGIPLGDPAHASGSGGGVSKVSLAPAVAQIGKTEREESTSTAFAALPLKDDAQVGVTSTESFCRLL
jgi:hypothetical protein